MKKDHRGDRRNFWTGTAYRRITPQPPTGSRQPLGLSKRVKGCLTPTATGVIVFILVVLAWLLIGLVP